MTKAIYTGVDGVARKAKAMYVGVDGVARKVKKAYVGVDGVAKLVYQSEPPEPQPLSQVTIKITNTVLGGTGVGIECIIPALGISAVSNGRAEAVFTQGKIMRGETYTVCAYRENGIEYKRQDFTAADADTDIWYLDVKSLVGEGPRLRVYTIDSTTGSVHTGNLVSGVPLEIVYAAGPSVPGFAEQTTGEDGSVQWSAMAPLNYGDYAIKVVENENWEESLFPFFWEDSDRTFLMLVTPKVKVDTLIMVKDYEGFPLSGVNVRINKTSIGITDTAGTILTRQSLGDNIEITLDLLGYTSVRTNVVIENGSPFQITIPMPKTAQIIFDSCGGSEIERIDTYQGATFNSFPTPERASYVFKGWYLDDALTEPVVYPFVVSNNTALTAKWEKESGGGGGDELCSVVFETNGGTALATQKVKKDEALTQLPTPSKEGYNFQGWFTDKALQNAVTLPFTITQNITLYASWTAEIDPPASLTITINSVTGGSAFADKTTVEIGKSVMLVASPAQNYIFVKWIIYNSDGNELVTSTDNPFTYTPEGDIIVEAVFEKALTPGWVGTNVANYQTARTGFTVPADVNVLKWTMNPYGDTVYISVIPGVHYEIYRYSMSNPAQGKPYVQHLEFTQQTGSLKRVIYHKEVTTEAEHDEMILTSPMQFFYSSEINNHAVDMKALPYYNTFSVILEEPMLGGGTTDVEGITKAAQYQDITITATPDIGYTFMDWQITPTGENPQVVIENPYTFTMPAKNIIITPNFNEDIIIDPPVPSDPITLVFKVTGTDGPPSGYTVKFTYPSGSLIFQGTTSALGTVRMNAADYPIYAEDGMTATATKGSYTGTITINAADVSEDKANTNSEIIFDIPIN